MCISLRQISFNFFLRYVKESSFETNSFSDPPPVCTQRVVGYSTLCHWLWFWTIQTTNNWRTSLVGVVAKLRGCWDYLRRTYLKPTWTHSTKISTPSAYLTIKQVIRTWSLFSIIYSSLFITASLSLETIIIYFIKETRSVSLCLQHF